MHPSCTQKEKYDDKRVALPSRGLVGLALLSPLDSRAILFRANKALPAFCFAKRKKKCQKSHPRNNNSKITAEALCRGVTFHFCLARNFFIFSLDRFLVSSSPDSNAAIQE